MATPIAMLLLIQAPQPYPPPTTSSPPPTPPSSTPIGSRIEKKIDKIVYVLFSILILVSSIEKKMENELEQNPSSPPPFYNRPTIADQISPPSEQKQNCFMECDNVFGTEEVRKTMMPWRE